MCTSGAGEGARAACLGCWGEGLCFAKGGKYFAAMIPLSAFYYKLPQCWDYEAAGDEAGSSSRHPATLATASGTPELQTRCGSMPFINFWL